MAQFLRSLENAPIRLAENRIAETDSGLRGVIDELGRIAGKIDPLANFTCEIETKTDGTAKMTFRAYTRYL